MSLNWLIPLARPALPALLLAILLCSPAAQAAPAPWYLWQSKLNGQTICLQHSPGPGWYRVQGPFQQDNCRP
ncbi:hypothetical protein [Methylobacillus glycogenes]|uniref:hypothetical protein n=1 Tax=Methylobacillus glycogenes TaxID=406 RepID=UPI000560289D|nr:hypothetical protein [Methylobacillus glycogenes]